MHTYNTHCMLSYANNPFTAPSSITLYMACNPNILQQHITIYVHIYCMYIRIRIKRWGNWLAMCLIHVIMSCTFDCGCVVIKAITGTGHISKWNRSVSNDSLVWFLVCNKGSLEALWLKLNSVNNVLCTCSIARS